MMLIGLGEPFMDRKIFDRIEYCARHNISTLLSTNGTFFDEKTCARLLDTPLEHITLSFDGATKESYEYYRKGAKFEKVRDNFVRFARMKHERGAKVQVVVQMVRMERNAGEVDDFMRFWSAVPGRRSGSRSKKTRPTCCSPRRWHAAQDWKHPCHYLWRGPMYVKHNGDVYPCCQSYMLDGRPVGNVGGAAASRYLEFRRDAAHAQAARRGARRRDRDLLALLHHHSASDAGGGEPAVAWPDCAAHAALGGAYGLFFEAATVAIDAGKEERSVAGISSDRFRAEMKRRSQ